MVIPRFEVLRRGEVLQVLPINRNRVVIGSEDGAHLRLKHPAIAPRHLEVTVVNGRYLEAANLAGEGRVLLGGQPMNRARLRADDELDLGPVTLRLSYVRSDRVEDSPVPNMDTGEFTAPASPEEEESTVSGSRAPFPQSTESDVPGPPAVGRAGSSVDAESDTSSRLSTLGELLVAPGTATSEDLPTLPPVEQSETGRMALDLDESVLDPAPIVIIEPPGGKGQEVPLRVGSFVVGAGRCAFRLSYPGVAPAHTEIMVMPDGIVYVKHLAGSGLLTLRNGAPIQFARWAAGDRLQVGPVAMRLELVSRQVVAAATHVTKVPATHAGSSVTTAPPPPLVGDDEQTVEEQVEALQKAFSGNTTFSGRALPSSATGEEPAPLAKPLVKVHKTAKQPAAKKRKRERRAAPRSNSVEVSLDVTSYETFQSFDDDLDYRPSAARRLFLPGLIALLLLLIGGQYFYIQDRLVDEDFSGSSGPMTASGSSGLGEATQGASTIGDGPVQVGEHRTQRRDTPGRTAGSGGGSKRMDIDWEDSRSGIRFEGARRSSYSGATELSARPADDIERAKAVTAPTTVGGDQGFVDMKIVNGKVTSAHRKFRYCYEQARQQDDSLEGVMWLNMTLSNDGRIRGVVVEGRSTLKSETMRKCMEKKLFSLKMPKPSGGAVTFSAPFQFAPSGP